jgi:hypothetical protein
MDENSDFITTEQYDLETIVPGAENNTLEDGTVNFPIGSNDFIDFSVIDPFSEGHI